MGRSKPGSNIFLPNWLTTIIKVVFILVAVWMIASAISVLGFIYSNLDRGQIFLYSLVIGIIIVMGWAIVSAGNRLATRPVEEFPYVPPQVEKPVIDTPPDAYQVGEIPPELRRDRARRV